MNSCPRMTTVDYARHDTAQGFIIVPKGRLIAPFYVETHLGPWGWQWRGGVSGMVSVPQPSIPITVKTLMDDIEKDAPGMYRTVTDFAYSISPECPFLIDEMSMANLRSRLCNYQDENAMLSPDAQVGVRKSVAAALGERKGFTQEESVRALVYPYSVDVGRLVDDLCGPQLPPGNFSIDECDRGSGTMSMDLGTDDDMPQTPPEMSSLLKVVGSKVGKGVVGADRVVGPPGGHL